MATHIRSDAINDIFQLSNGEYVKFPRTMEMSEKDVEEFYEDDQNIMLFV